MSNDTPFGMGGFFPGMLGDLMRLMKSDGPIQFELALQLAQSIAADGVPDNNADPVARITLEELTKIAELHVADVTGMATTATRRPIEVVAVSPPEWARLSLTSWQETIEQIAAALAAVTPTEVGTDLDDSSRPFDDDDANKDDLTALLSQWTTVIGPALTAMQVGSIIGRLARRSLGQYELVLPRRASDTIVVVPGNISSFAEDWSIPKDDLALYVSVRDVATHSVMSRAHVADQFVARLVAHARGFRQDLSTLESRLGDADLSDMNGLARVLSDPLALGEAAESPAHRRARDELQALGSVILGYVEWVAATVAERSIASRGAIHEAIRRRRVERSDDERAADALFGLSFDQDTYDRGEAFVRGVLERGGEHELAKLWVIEKNLPTPAEVDAPGLWIERINLDIDLSRPGPQDETDQPNEQAGS